MVLRVRFLWLWVVMVLLADLGRLLVLTFPPLFPLGVPDRTRGTKDWLWRWMDWVRQIKFIWVGRQSDIGHSSVKKTAKVYQVFLRVWNYFHYSFQQVFERLKSMWPTSLKKAVKTWCLEKLKALIARFLLWERSRLARCVEVQLHRALGHIWITSHHQYCHCCHPLRWSKIWGQIHQ